LGLRVEAGWLPWVESSILTKENQIPLPPCAFTTSKTVIQAEGCGSLRHSLHRKSHGL
jgi:hypothetical protein